MNKFCMKCGTEIPEGSEFCPKCGEKVENSNSSLGNKKILPFAIGGGIAIAVLVLVIILVVTLGGNNPKSVAVKFCNAAYKGNANKVVKLTLPEYYDELDSDEKERFKEYIKELGETIKDNDGTVTCKYDKQEKITGDDLEDLKEELSDDYGADISEAYEVTLKMTAKKGDDSMTQNGSLVVVKSGSKYYVYDGDGIY